MKCERCNGPAERSTEERETYLCPRCGIWLHPDGAEIGPPISHEQAQANYEKFVVDIAAQTIKTAREQKLDLLVECGVITHEQADRLKYPALWKAADDIIASGTLEPGGTS